MDKISRRGDKGPRWAGARIYTAIIQLDELQKWARTCTWDKDAAWDLTHGGVCHTLNGVPPRPPPAAFTQLIRESSAASSF